jgi:glutamine synthetase
VSFVEKHGLASAERRERAAAIVRTIEVEGLETIRFAFPDQHGVLRGKTLVADEAVKAFDSGVLVTATLIAKDTAHRTVFPVFNQHGGHTLEGLAGGGDIVLVADLTTFRVLPWSPKSGWVLCDAYLADGRPVPYATRNVLRQAVSGLASRGWEMLAGIEVEFHVFRMEDPKLTPADATQPGTPPQVGCRVATSTSPSSATTRSSRCST